MIGAIIGDIVGSVYEWHNIRTKEFPFFVKRGFFTDDTVMTVAVADALLRGGKPDDYIDAMKEWGRRYPAAGYGGRFGRWLHQDDRAPYNSYGNGAAMRVSPAAQAVYGLPLPGEGMEERLVRAQRYAQDSAAVTHNHEEGLKGARATAWCMTLARELGPEAAKQRILLEGPLLFGYDLGRTLDDIRPTYRFDESCQGTVPEAIIAFLEAEGFEDAIRNAISLGGDSDTLAAITGAIAQAAWGVPEDIRAQTLTYLDPPMLEVLQRFEQWVGG